MINKTDLAEAVGANLEVMRSDAAKIRDGGPMCFCQVPSSPPLLLLPYLRTPSRELCCIAVLAKGGTIRSLIFSFSPFPPQKESRSHGRYVSLSSTAQLARLAAERTMCARRECR